MNLHIVRENDNGQTVVNKTVVDNNDITAILCNVLNIAANRSHLSAGLKTNCIYNELQIQEFIRSGSATTPGSVDEIEKYFYAEKYKIHYKHRSDRFYNLLSATNTIDISGLESWFGDRMLDIKNLEGRFSYNMNTKIRMDYNNKRLELSFEKFFYHVDADCNHENAILSYVKDLSHATQSSSQAAQNPSQAAQNPSQAAQNVSSGAPGSYNNSLTWCNTMLVAGAVASCAAVAMAYF